MGTQTQCFRCRIPHTNKIVSSVFPVFSHEKRLLASKGSTVILRLSAMYRSVPTGRISVEFDTGDFYENLSEKSKIG